MKTEYILCAAMKYNGMTITGYRHRDCINTLEKLLNLPSSDSLPGRESQGFLTSKNRFVYRKEAYKIAKANNQLILPPKKNDENEELASEDIYFYFDETGDIK